MQGGGGGGEGALPYMGYIICLCCGKGHGFQVGYQFSPVDVTYNNCIQGVILRQSNLPELCPLTL